MIRDSERKTYEFIVKFIQENGFAPKLPEIAKGIGISSTGVVHRYVQGLVKAKLISIVPRRHRGIKLNEPLAEHKVKHAHIPLVGTIAAGQPISAVQDDQSIDLANLFSGKSVFALKVQGSSMIEEGILNDDLVICERREEARNGEIVVALIDDEEATLKRINFQQDGNIQLIPANHTMTPMTYSSDRIRIQGVFLGLIRQK